MSEAIQVDRRLPWRAALRHSVVALLLTWLAMPVGADYVGSLVNRIFIDPASIVVVSDGFDNGDEVSFILETTPADTGSDNGHAAWMSVYIPPGVEVVGAEFVLPSGTGGYDPIPAEDTDIIADGWGNRGSKGYGPTSGATQLANGYLNEGQGDTGIFYSTDRRAQLVIDGVDDDCDGTPDTVDPTGVPAQLAYNRFDWDHTLAFGIGGAISGNGGTGNTPVRGTTCLAPEGCTWTGVGSIVSGPQTYYTNDYNPGYDDCSDGPGGLVVDGCDGDGIRDGFLDETACVGPWQRIKTDNAKLGGSNSPRKCRPGNTCPTPDAFEPDPTIIFPAWEKGAIAQTAVPVPMALEGWDFGVSDALPSGNLPLSANPSPDTTYMVRFVHGKRRLGELENARITLRIIDSTLFNANVFIDDGVLEATDDETFCLDSTGGDTSDPTRYAQDNPFRYYEPKHECAFLAGKGNLFKGTKFVNNQPSNGASLSVGDIVSYRITFTNIAGTTLTDIDLYDRAEDFFGVPTGNLDLIDPGNPLCAYPSYDGDLPGPSYLGITGGEAQWAQIPSLLAGEQVSIFLCAEITGGGINDRLDNSALVDYSFSPSPADRVVGLKSTTGGTITTSISGAVYSDVDASGSLTPGDAAAVGVTVSLYVDENGNGELDGGDTLVDSFVTLTDGSYSFAGIPADDYIVVETDPVGWTSTGDKDNLGGPCGVGNGCNTIGTITVPAGGASIFNDFFDLAPLGAQNFISGTTFVDRDLDMLFEPADGEVGQGGILVSLWRDSNGNMVIDGGDALLGSQTSDILGNYLFSLTEDPAVICPVAGCDYLVEIDDDTLPPGASRTTVPNLKIVHFNDLGNESPGNDFGFFGGPGTTGGVCFAVADSIDELVAWEIVPSLFTDIGPTGTFNIEAIAYEPGTGTLCAADADRMGTLDLGTGLFTALPSAFGTCKLPGGGTVSITDVDGLTFDPYTRLLWGVNRVGGVGGTVNDVLVVIDPATGRIAPDDVDPFGPLVTCVEIDSITPLGLSDIDDIAIDPTARKLGGGPLLYAIANQDPGPPDPRAGSGVDDHLILIDTTDGSVTDIARVMLGVSGLDDIEGLGFGNDGTLYGTTGNQITPTNDQLYTIDRGTAAATLVTNLFRAGPPILEDYESIDCLTAGANVITGTVFADGDGNGALDPGNPGQAGVTVSLYHDENGNNLVDPGEELLQTTISDANGEYTFFLGVEGNFVLDTDFPATYPVGAVLTLGEDNVEEADFVGFNQTEADNNFGFVLPNVPEIVKTSSAAGGVVAQGGTITYTLIPRIPGPQLLSDIEVEDFIPAGTSFVTGSAAPTQSEGPDPLEWELGSHESGIPGTVESALCPAQLSLTPVADTFIDAESADTNFGGAGQKEIKTRPEFVDPNDDKRKHGLLRFDISGIPADAVLDQAVLTLTGNAARSNHLIEIHEMLTPWIESGTNGATWNDAAGLVNDWVTPVDPLNPEDPNETDSFAFGTSDYDATVHGTPFAPVGGNTDVTVAVDSLVASWLAGTNNGLVMLATGTDNGDGKWYTKEDGPAREPKLLVSYRVPTSGGCTDVSTLVASADTYLQEDKAGDNLGAAADLLSRPEATKHKHVLVDFDLTGIVPDGAIINSATFTVEVTTNKNNDITVHRMLTPWTESEATWNDATGTSDWVTVATGTENPLETDGSTFGASDYAESYPAIPPSFSISTTGAKSVDVTGMVDMWINGGATRAGLAMIVSGSDNGDAKFDSREGTNPPTLEIDWTLAPDQTTNEITALGTLVSDGDAVTVTMTLTSAKDDTNVTPGPLTVNGVNGATATGCGTPSPAMQNISGGTPITFDWTCTANAALGELLGRLTFEADAAGDNLAFDNALSHNVMVTRPLVFSVLVDNPIDANQTTIVNTGIVDSDQTYPPGTDTVLDAVVKGAIGDRVWLDTDGDGVQDIGEEGIAAVEVTLYDVGPDGMPGGGDDVPAGTAMTDANGNYLFTKLAPGTYYVVVTDATLPPGLTAAPGTTDPSGVRTVTIREVFLDLDFGYVPDPGTSVIGDYIWSDADGDGIQGPGEPGIGGVTVDLVSPGADGLFGTPDDVVEDTVSTAADGSYLFSGVVSGEYEVVVTDTGGVLVGYTPTSGPQSQGDFVSDPITVLEDDVFVEADFGFQDPTLFEISDRLWLDADGDGVQDPDEPGLAGVTIDLLFDPNGIPNDGDEVVIATVTTDANGDFTFDGVEGGGGEDYMIQITDTDGVLNNLGGTTTDAQAGWLAITDLAADFTGIDFGYNAPGSIGDRTWSDADGDGVQDPGELGIGGALLNLLDDMGGPVLDALGNPITATTAPDGSYLFLGVQPGDYTVEVDASNFGAGGALAGYTQTGDPDEIGTCVTCDDEGAATVDLNTSDLSLDFGYQNGALAEISGTVFEDLDTDALQDAGENGFAGVTVTLRLVYEVIDGRLDTNGDGMIDGADDGSIGGFAIIDGEIDVNGDGVVDGSDDGVLDSVIGPVTVIDGRLDLNGDAMVDGADDGSIDGDVIATATTNATGDYVFTDVPDGDYAVSVTDDAGVLEGYTLTSALDRLDVTVAGVPVMDVDFGYVQRPGTGSIGDSVFLDANGDGVQGPNEPGISGVQVDLYDAGPDGIVGTPDDIFVGSTITDAKGKYDFGGLEAGSYYVDIPTPPASLTSTTGGDTTGAIALSEGEDYNDADFGYEPLAGDAAIGDTVWYDSDGDGFQDPDEIGIGGIDVEVLGVSPGSSCMSGCTVTTAPDGTWLLAGLNPGDYVVVIDLADIGALGYSTTPTNNGGDDSYNLTLAAGDVIPTLDWGFSGGTTNTIGDTVWLDADANGVEDPGEAGVEGVTVNLIDSMSNIVATTTADENGLYQFSGVPDGTFTIQVSDIDNVLVGLQATGDPDEVGPCTICDLETTVVVAGGVTIITADFGFAPEAGLGSIGSLVWYDVNNDGVYQPGEPPLEGVTLECWHDRDGDGVLDIDGTDNLIRSVITDETGEYFCEGIPDGDYIVRLTDEFGVLSALGQTVLGVPGVDNNNQAQPYAVSTTGSNLTADFGYVLAVGPRQISGTVFEDKSNDGNLDGGEPLIESATVYLFQDLNGDGVLDPGEPLVATTTSDMNGDYSFTGLPDNDDYIVVTDTGGTAVDKFLQTTQSGTGGVQPVSLSGSDSTGNDFGYYSGGFTTTPVTLAFFEATGGGGLVSFRWSTATEVGNLGFNLFVLTDEGLEQLNEELIASHVVDSIDPQHYEYEATGVRGETFVIEDVDIRGVLRHHGPFELFESAGNAELAVDPIEWAPIRQKTREKQELRVKKRGRIFEMAEPANGGDVGATGRRLGAVGLKRRPGGSGPSHRYEPVRLEVTQDGIHRVRHEDLLAAGIDWGGAPLVQIAVTRAGEAVPVRVEGSGAFGPGSYVEFLGEAIETLYTKTNVYRLELDKRKALRVTEDGSFPVGSAPISYVERAKVERNLKYHYASPTGDPWYESRLLATSGPVETTVPLEMDSRVGNSGPVTVRVVMWGVTDFPVAPDHHVKIEINGVQVAERFFDGLREEIFEIEVPESALEPTGNTLTIRLPHDTEARYDLVNFDYYEVSYPRRFEAVAGRLEFTEAGGTFRVDGLASSDVVAYRVDEDGMTHLQAPLITGAPGSYSASFAGVGDMATYFLSATEAVRIPRLEPAPRPVDLGGRRAELLIVSHPDFVEGLEPLVEARRGQGLSVKVVSVEDLYEQFAAGVVDPEAIRAYIGWAHENLGTKSVLLVGGDTYDYHDYLGLGAVSFVPTLYAQTDPIVKYAPVDPLYTDVDSDGVPDLAIGRFPVRSSEELAGVIAKTLEYGGAPDGGTLLLAADGFDVASGYSFTAASDEMASYLPAEWDVSRAYIDELGLVGARQSLLDGMNEGARLVSYFGHSGPSVWSFDSLFTSADAGALENSGRPMVVTQWGCWNTYFVSPSNETLSNRLLLGEDRGAAAVLGASTLTQADSERLLGGLVFRNLAEPGVSLGQAILQAKRELAETRPGIIDVILGWTLLGDPTLVLNDEMK